MKREIKINFIYYEEPFDFEKNYFVKLLKKKYKVVLSDKPDYVFFSVYEKRNNFVSERDKVQNNTGPAKTGLIRKIKKSKFIQNLVGSLKFYRIIGRGKVPNISGDFVKIFYTFENVKPDMKKCDWAFSFYYDEDIKNNQHMRLPFYTTILEDRDSLRKKLDLQEIRKDKTRFCNFIYSSNIPFRNKFFKELSKYKQVDAPGKCMNNMPPIGSFGSAQSSRDSKDWVKQKQDFLKKYKFTIAFENTPTKGYTTEKIVQPMLANSIPVYFGNPEVGREFNKKSFIDLRDFKNMKELVEEIKKIDRDDELYFKMLKEPWLKNNIPNEWMDEEKILNRLVRIIESKHGRK